MLWRGVLRRARRRLFEDFLFAGFEHCWKKALLQLEESLKLGLLARIGIEGCRLLNLTIDKLVTEIVEL